MDKTPSQKGKEFEAEVGRNLRELADQFPTLVTIKSQERVRLRDGRIRIIDFSIDYTLGGTLNRIAIECQDRQAWTTGIIDKILTIRTQSYRNRFWYIYYGPDFLTDQAKAVFKEHGIMAFSLDELKAHLRELRFSLQGALAAEALRSREDLPEYDPPMDPALPPPPGGWVK